MILDCTGERCPQPVIMLARLVRDAEQGTIITISTDDPAALVDIPAWCRMRGHHCAHVEGPNGIDVHEVTVQRRS